MEDDYLSDSASVHYGFYITNKPVNKLKYDSIYPLEVGDRVMVTEKSEYGSRSYNVRITKIENNKAYAILKDGKEHDITKLMHRTTMYAKGGGIRAQKRYNKEVDAYKWFIVDLENKKAVSGWEFQSDAKDALEDYDGDKNFKVVSERTLSSIGVENPKERFKMMEHGGSIKEKDSNYYYILRMIENNQKSLKTQMSTEDSEETQREIQRLKDKLKNEYGQTFAEGGSISSKMYHVVNARQLDMGSSRPVVASFDTRSEAREYAKDQNITYDADVKMFIVMTTAQLKAEGIEEFARGGFVGKGELVWRKLSSSKRIEFLNENFTPEITPRSQEILVGKSYDFLPKKVKDRLNSKYANVEEYAEGGGVSKYYNKENEYRLSRPSGSIEKEILDKVTFKNSIDEEYFVGNFGWKTTQGKLGDGYLYKLDDFDQSFTKDIKLKEGEKIFRYVNRTSAIGGMTPFIKINLEKGLLYFPIYSETDEVSFQSKGDKALWINIIENKYAEGGSADYDDYSDGKQYARGGISKDDSPKIYVADLAAYNEGKLIGEWLDLTDYDDADDLMAAIYELMARFSEEQGVEREEWAIHDYENIPSNLASEYMGRQDFEIIYDLINAADDRGVPYEVLAEAMAIKGEDDAERVADNYYGEYDSFKDFAYNLVDETGVSNINNLDFYFDYESFGSDERINMGSEEEEEMGYEDMSDEDLGYELVEQMGGLDNLSQQTIEMYFDYDKFARDLELDYDEIRMNGNSYIFFSSYKRGGIAGKSRYNSGWSWKMDRAKQNVKETYERPMESRKRRNK
jgi:antirestriction protein